ncbi:MAG: GNAT family N-acetyltransferase [Gemmatimonadaceae bacterium]|jgi:GNAT superfamily N-acetyltransferase|nr:GNAT family N-acetyltransferase [Gemmatimonadaceae bacterium]
MLQITHATTPDELDTIRALFREYATQVGPGGGAEMGDDELAKLPGIYAAPAGRLLLASDGSGPVGCAALMPRESLGCELKGLYVRPQARGKGVARRLATTAIETARAIGYRQMLLETRATMFEAQALYRSLGFQPERRAPARVGWKQSGGEEAAGPMYFWLDLSGPGIR